MSPSDSQQLRQTLDQFWFSRLDENELTPPEEASPEQLLRRLHYVVTGLTSHSRRVGILPQ